jgi:hypothetical protein
MTAQETDAPSAALLIEQAIELRIDNDPTLTNFQFKYTSYQNLKVSGDPEAITGPGYKKTELRKTLLKTRVLYAEKSSVQQYDPEQGHKEIITGINMPGFKKPVYPIYTINFQSENVYERQYVILDQGFISPLTTAGLKTYNYKVVTDTVLQDRPVTKVYFYHDGKKTNVLNGHIFIDKASKAVAQVQYFNSGTINIAANHFYRYDETYDLWLPYERDLFIKKEKDKKELEIFGARLQVGTESENNRSKNAGDLYLILRTKNSDFTFSENVELNENGVEIDILKSALSKDELYWSTYREKNTLSNDDLARFMQLDSVVMATNVTRKLETIDKFKVGYYPIGFFDVDLKYLVKFNDYEAFRLGIGGVTNEKLSENWRLGGYLAYGTKDDAFKYKINVGYRLNKEKDTWLNIYRQDDITEFAAESFLTDARVYSLFEPRLINIPTFYLYKEHGVSLQQRPFASVIGELSLSRKRIVQTTSYIFQPDENSSFREYVLSEAVLGVRWSPLSKFMRTPKGFQETKAGYPVLSGQVTKGLSNVVDSDFDYLKLSGKVTYAIKSGQDQMTEITVEGHYASGDVPLTHLFHAYPNAPTKDEVLQRFSVAGRRSFETMYFNEFFSDRLLVSQLKHRFPAFDIASFLKPELVLISRFAIGDLDDPQQHRNVNFSTLEHGYLESGFELNKLIFGFGLSASYRYGAYHLPDIEDNIALKFTFYLEL